VPEEAVRPILRNLLRGVNIFAARLKKPAISILSDAFLSK
jgi:hypothetical protein